MAAPSASAQNVISQALAQGEDIYADTAVPFNFGEDRFDPDKVKQCVALEQNDTDNGKRLLIHFGHEILFVRDVGWHTYDGTRWCLQGGDEAVQKYAQKTAKRIAAEANFIILSDKQAKTVLEANLLRKQGEPEGGFSDAQKALLREADVLRARLAGMRANRIKFSISCGNSARLAGMIIQAKAHCTLEIDEMDADPLAFNVRNGTLYFLPGQWCDEDGYMHGMKIELRPHNRADKICKIAPVVYDPHAVAKKFDANMNLFQPDVSIRTFKQTYFGLALTGLTGEQMMVYDYGTGSNGKSTILQACKHVFGDYANIMNYQSICDDGQRRGDQATPDLAKLPGVRFLSIAEIPRKAKLNEALLKSMTGGEEMMVRHLNKGFFTFKPVFKLNLSGNHQPNIEGGDHGIWRRMRLVPWDFKMPDKDKRSFEKIHGELVEESSGILNWLLEGLDRYFIYGLQTPESIREATHKLQEDIDDLFNFITACITVLEKNYEQARHVYNAYKAWCANEGKQAWSEKAFSQGMKSKGFNKVKQHVNRSQLFFYENIMLHDVPENHPPPENYASAW